MIQKIGEWVSLTATIPTILLAIVVVHAYGKKCLPWVRSGEPFSRVQWLILGITLGFLGQVLDNVFWQVAWTLEFLELPWRQEVFQSGAWFNIVNRQLLGCLAALCHLRSAFLASSKDAEFDTEQDRRFFWSVLCGSVFVGVMYGLVMLLLSYLRM